MGPELLCTLTWVKRDTVSVKCLAQEHNAVPWPVLKPGPPDPESSALTIRPPCLQQKLKTNTKKPTRATDG